jgi:hypothetical protein
MYTEGICHDGAAILKDGLPITISEILSLLNRLDEAENVIRYYTKNGQTKRVQNGIIEFDVDAGPLYDYKYISYTDEGQTAKEYLERHKIL